MTVAALYVDTACGPYARIDDVECWGFATKRGLQTDFWAVTSDARRYDGPHPVVAHPPCGPWGRFWWNYKGGEGAMSCGPRAIAQARDCMGIVEHPAQSGLWSTLALPKPGDPPDQFGGWTIEVQQCDWGHKARKPTWLYMVGVRELPPMPPKREPTHVMVRLLRNGNNWPEVPKRERHLTPPSFAQWLVDAASTAGN